jgi:heat shock protein HtpX
MWEQIQANKRRSAALIVSMSAVLILTGYAAGVALAGPDGGVLGIFIALAVFTVMMGVYFMAAESVLLAGSGAREVDREDSPRLFNVVEEMKLAAGLPYMPRVYLIDDPAPNAFAIGRNPETSAVAVTTGLMYRLDRDELQGVIAHEIAHLKNKDVQFMTLAAVMLGSIVILSELVQRSMWLGGRGRRRSDSRGGGQAQLIILVVALLFAILGPVMAQILYFACSRKREFLADASAVQYTRYPEGLASALEKIAGYRTPVSFASKVNAPMFIVNPLYAASGEPSSIFSTHPPTTERIRILRGMAGASLTDYELAYRQQTSQELIGARSLQSDAAQPVRPSSAEGPIETRQDVLHAAHRRYGYIALSCTCGLEISVPERYERPEIRCFRCGSAWPIPKAVPPVMSAEVSESGRIPVGATPLRFARSGRGWESFRCGCGRTVQISPAFSAPRIRCRNCQREIEVT